MIFQYVIQSIYALAVLFLVYKICQLINVCIREYRETEKLRREILKMDRATSKQRLNEVKK